MSDEAPAGALVRDWAVAHLPSLTDWPGTAGIAVVDIEPALADLARRVAALLAEEREACAQQVETAAAAQEALGKGLRDGPSRGWAMTFAGQLRQLAAAIREREPGP